MELFQTLSIFVTIILRIREVTSFSANEVMKGDVTTLYTPNYLTFERYWIELYARDYFVFSVRACGDVHLAMAEVRSDTSFNLTELVIGGWYNTRSVIRNGLGDREHFLDVETPQVLHCTEFRTFWVEWGTRMRVGRGPIPGEQVFMDLEHSRHFVTAIGFSTGFGNTGVWKIAENQGHYMFVHTPDDYRYEYLWKTTEYMDHHFLFRVSACSDVHLNLSPLAGQVHYEVVLGGWNNTKSIIRYGGVHRAEYLETGIINCTEFRFFWIEWESGMIRVGKGENVRRNQILNATDPGFVGINHISISAGHGHTANWLLSEDLENLFKFRGYSPDSFNLPVYSVYVITSRQNFITFEVMGCSNAWIVLTGYNGFLDMGSNHIYIGGENNTRTGVKLGQFGNTILNETGTPNILHCVNPNWFWVSWSGGTAHLGRGNSIGQFELLRWNSSAVPRVNVVGFTSTDPNGVDFLIRKNTGDGVYTETTGVFDRRQMWISVRQQLIFRFQVRACHSAHLTLSGYVGVHDEQTYEIILGSCYRTVIRDHIAGIPNEIAAVNSSDVVSCTEHRTYWVSWIDGFVRVGHGYRYGRGLIIEIQQRKPHPINAINIDTYGTSGEWEVESDNGDFLLMTSVYNSDVIKWFHLHRWTHWFHFLVSGNAAHLILASRYHDPLDVYNIYIGASDNTEVAIWKNSNLLSRVHTPNVIDRTHMRAFWVSWEGGQIKIGRTRQRDLFPILEYKDSSPYHITAIGLAGDRGAFAEWRIWENIALEMGLTSISSAYFEQAWWSVRHRTSSLFALRTCGRAEIALSAVMHEYFSRRHSYLLVLNDNNGTTSIWRGMRAQKLTEVATSDVVSCSSERFYWLSWHEGHIAFGRGLVKGKHTIISFQDMEALAITAISFTTAEGEGYWRVPMTWDEFQVVPPRRDPNALSAGEIVGIVFGALVIVVLFVFLLMKILAPTYTDNLIVRAKDGITGLAPSLGSNGTTTNGSRGSSNSFDNPVAMNADAFSEVHIS